MNSKDGSQQQQTTPAGGGKPAQQTQWFISEIQQMMHGLGDCRKPLHESAVLVEEIVQQQLMILMYKAGDVANVRSAKMIGIEDILFLLRKDKVKLRRLLRYMKFRDIKASVARNASVDDDDPPEHGEKQPVSKRRKLCYDFLSTIDQTGELTDLFDDEGTDDIKHERLLRADLQSRCLEPQKYLEFCEARQVNFSRKYKSQRFKDWLFGGLNLDMKPSIHCLEILSYLAYETIAQIVDLALLVKRDMSASPSDPLIQSFPGATHNFNETAEVTAILTQAKSLPTITSPTVSPPSTPVTTASALAGGSGPGTAGKSKSKKKKKGSGPDTLKSQVHPIRPADIREAMRRYSAFVGPFASEIVFRPGLTQTGLYYHRRWLEVGNLGFKKKSFVCFVLLLGPAQVSERKSTVPAEEYITVHLTIKLPS